METKTWVVAVIWDPSKEGPISYIRVQANKTFVETGGPARSQYFLDDKLMLEVPDANYRGDSEETN